MWSSATVFQPVGANSGLIGAVASSSVSGHACVPYPSLHRPCPNARAANGAPAAANPRPRSNLRREVVRSHGLFNGLAGISSMGPLFLFEEGGNPDYPPP